MLVVPIEYVRQLFAIHILEQNKHFIVVFVYKFCFDHILAIYELKQIVFLLDTRRSVCNRGGWH